MSVARVLPFQGQVMAVAGPVDPGSLDVVDAHNHLWIDALDGVPLQSPHLTEYDAIRSELGEYMQAGGSAVVDCQPGGCGRNGSRLLQLSRDSGVSVIAATGFHRRRYYPPSWWIWDAPAQDIARYFIDEIRRGLKETLDLRETVRAGLIKCACEVYAARDTAGAAGGSSVGCGRVGSVRRSAHGKGRRRRSHPGFLCQARRASQPNRAVPHGQET